MGQLVLLRQNPLSHRRVDDLAESPCGGPGNERGCVGFSGEVADWGREALSLINPPCGSLRYAEPMATWFLYLFLVSLALVLIWAWRRTHLSRGSNLPTPQSEKAKFETTMGDLRDLRQALRPLQKGQPKE